MKNMTNMQHNTTLLAKPHYVLLDGLRGVAAILVLFYHIFEGESFHKFGNSWIITDSWCIVIETYF